MRTRAICLSGGIILALLAANSIVMFPGAQPTLRSTHPFVLAVLAVLGVPLWLLALAYGGLFVLWTMIALRQGATIPRRSISLFVLCSLLSALVFVLGWSEGLTHLGARYVYSVLALDIVSISLLVALVGWNLRAPSIASSLLFHFTLFVWVCTFAMPWLGGREGP